MKILITILTTIIVVVVFVQWINDDNFYKNDSAISFSEAFTDELVEKQINTIDSINATDKKGNQIVIYPETISRGIGAVNEPKKLGFIDELKIQVRALTGIGDTCRVTNPSEIARQGGCKRTTTSDGRVFGKHVTSASHRNGDVTGEHCHCW